MSRFLTKYGKQKNPRSKTDPSERFWKKVDTLGFHGPKGECWLWLGAVAGQYGRFWNGERIVQAHHFAYEEKHEPVPAGMVLDHVECDFKLCVNPDHLKVCTTGENTVRHFAQLTHCARGHEYTPENTRTWRGKRACKTCISLNGMARKMGGRTKEIFG